MIIYKSSLLFFQIKNKILRFFSDPYDLSIDHA